MTDNYNTLEYTGPYLDWTRDAAIGVLLDVQAAIDGLGLEAALPSTTFRPTMSWVLIIIVTVWTRPPENYLQQAVDNISDRLKAKKGTLGQNFYEGKLVSFLLPENRRFMIEFRGIGAFAPPQKKQASTDSIT